MQLIVDMVPVADHQVEGQVDHAALEAPLTFCGWLDFVRVIEAVLGGTDRSDGPSVADEA